MAADVVTRAGLALLLVSLGIAAYWLWTRRQLRRLAATAGAPWAVPGLGAFRPGAAAILYFTTPDCGVCRTTQHPALERLQADLGDQVQVLVVDAAAEPAVADHWGVVSVPTTFVLDEAGQPRQVNHGLASLARLRRQVKEVMVA